LLLPDNRIAGSPMDELPRFVRDLIASFPQAGDGVHRHLFRLARYLHALRSEPDIFALLRAASDVCGRKVSGQGDPRRDPQLQVRCLATVGNGATAHLLKRKIGLARPAARPYRRACPSRGRTLRPMGNFAGAAGADRNT
jgi:hypothetical protein